MTETVLSLTPAALARARDLIVRHGGDAVGIRLGVRTTGCSGYSYVLDFAQDQAPDDTVVELPGVRVLIDPRAASLVAGTKVDYVEDRLGAQFTFENPRETARCGCGESFSV